MNKPRFGPATSPATVRYELALIPPASDYARVHLMAGDVLGLLARIDELEAALRPFAAKATAWEARHPRRAGAYPARAATQISHRLGDFQVARVALGERP